MRKSAPAASKKPAERISGPFENPDQLPPRVGAMRDKILEACETGDIENLRPAIERNEVLPLFGRAGDRAKNFATAIAFLRQRSFDGQGREILALLQAVLKSPFVTIERGGHPLFVWPSFAVVKPAEIDQAMQLRILQCIAFSDLRGAVALNEAPLHRVEIGEDGTWHAFGIS